MRSLALAATLSLLAACHPRPDFRPGEVFADQSEKQTFIALRAVQASDEQRLVILKAWDESHPALARMADDADQLVARWRGLDRRDREFARNSDELAAKWSALSAERMKLTGAYEARVAATLDEEQWELWQEFWNRPAYAPRGAPQAGEGRRRR